MTALQLLTIIVAALLVQLALGIAVVARRRLHPLAQLPGPTVAVTPKLAVGAWSGWRAFRVSHRHHEDAAQSQCSFYLAPIDGTPLPPFLPGQYLTFSLPAGEPDGAAGAVASSITRC